MMVKDADEGVVEVRAILTTGEEAVEVAMVSPCLEISSPITTELFPLTTLATTIRQTSPHQA